MATPPRLWSLSALSAEFGLDRRTTAKRMASVPPDGLLARNAAWYLSTAAAVLLPKDGNGAEPVAKRAGGPFTAGGNPVDEGICTALLLLHGRVPIEMAITAIRAGVPLELVQEFYKGAVIRFYTMVDELAEELGITWASPSHFDLPPAPHWDALVSQNSA
jgi:hypothetical protein